MNSSPIVMREIQLAHQSLSIPSGDEFGGSHLTSTPLANGGTLQPFPNAAPMMGKFFTELSPLIEMSKETLRASSSCPSSRTSYSDMQSPLDGAVDCYNVSKDLPVIVPESMLSLDTVQYRVDRCLREGDFANCYLINPGERLPRLIAKVFNDLCFAELSVSRQLKQLLRKNEQWVSMKSGFQLFLDCYTFNNGHILTYEYLPHLTWRDVYEYVQKSCQVLEEETYAVFVLELLKIVRTLQSVGITHNDISANNLLFCGNAEAYKKTTKDFVDLPVSVVKLTNFHRAVHSASASHTPDFSGMLQSIQFLLFGKLCETAIVPLTSRTTFKGFLRGDWNRTAWIDLFNFLLQGTVGTDSLDKHIHAYCSIVRKGAEVAVMELSKLSQRLTND